MMVTLRFFKSCALYAVLMAFAVFLTACPVSTAPSVTSQPVSQTVAIGGSVTFTVGASGSSPLSFQWRKNGADIAGATASSYSIASVQESHEGSYSCLVSNAYGSVISNGATLTVSAELPVIEEQPASNVIGPGDSVSFGVTASGAGTLSYQWKKDGVSIPGASLEYYDIESAVLADNGVYSCVVSNGAGSTVSEGAELVVSQDYADGFDEGFALDDWYWQGFDDSYDTLYATPMYYQGGDIPFVETPYHERGYYDGVWYAYNDGYFVCYDDAFTIGFSEGYDAAFYPDYLTFLETDQHAEYGNGGWGDGYNDGFSEGRIFGANDYEQGLSFDWLDALLDYRSGTDLYFEEIDLGTGEYGPVYLYEYGTDPTAAKSARPALAERMKGRISVRNGDMEKDAKLSEVFYRTLTDDARAKLDQRPATTARSSRALTLTTTWLERIEAYQDAQKSPVKSARLRGVLE